MTFLVINPDNSIQEITANDDTGSGIEIMLDPDVDDLAEIKASRFGHLVFDYIGNAITLNQARFDAFLMPINKAALVTALKAEALIWMQAKLPGMDSAGTVELIRELWLSIDPAARQPTTDFQYVIDVYQAAQDAVIVINALPDQTALDNYDVTGDPDWPV